MAGTTGLEPATSAVTGQRSNQLSYVPTGADSGRAVAVSFVGLRCTHLNLCGRSADPHDLMRIE